MRLGVNIFRVILVAAWLVLLWVSAKAVAAMGANAAGAVFFGDMAHPWRAQFNVDFALHLLLVAGWLTYRDRVWIRGLLFGVLAIMFGGVFTLAFLLVETFRTKGDMRRVLLGNRA
jgi:hypothetical protein